MPLPLTNVSEWTPLDLIIYSINEKKYISTKVVKEMKLLDFIVDSDED